MRVSVALAAVACILPVLPAHAQDRSAGPPTYKVELNIADAGDAAAKSRHYTLRVEGSQKATFKAGSRIPVATSSGAPGGNPGYTYLDVGVNIECTINEVGGKLTMFGILDLSSVLPHEGAPQANPTVGQTQLRLQTTLDPGKPTLLASIDDPGTMRRLQVEATVTRIN